MTETTQTTQENLTILLEAWNSGDEEAAAKVLPVVYDELRRIAHLYCSHERRGHTLQATAVVHEAYVRLIEGNDVRWQSRTHLVGTMAHMMRRILVDYARRRNTGKRGGKESRVTLSEARALAAERSPDLLEVDDALTDLARLDPQKARVVELRFFGGLTIEETAEFLDVSPATIVRQWRAAKAWLFGQLSEAQAT